MSYRVFARFARAAGVVALATLAVSVLPALASTGGAGISGTPHKHCKGRVRINDNGTATAPSCAPRVVKRMVAAANRIIDKPYVYGGGHGQWNDSGYDCSGAVSYALHGGGLLSQPEDSTELESFGRPGKGRWVTVYANENHTWIVIAGRAFDTANFGGPNIPDGDGPRWRFDPTGNYGDGQWYAVRHPAGL